MKNKLLNEIICIINDSECIQESNESQYTKECAKMFAYDQIRELIEGVENDENK